MRKLPALSIIATRIMQYALVLLVAGGLALSPVHAVYAETGSVAENSADAAVEGAAENPDTDDDNLLWWLLAAALHTPSLSIGIPDVGQLPTEAHAHAPFPPRGPPQPV
jgi:hypothetical protein